MPVVYRFCEFLFVTVRGSLAICRFDFWRVGTFLNDDLREDSIDLLFTSSKLDIIEALISAAFCDFLCLLPDGGIISLRTVPEAFCGDFT